MEMLYSTVWRFISHFLFVIGEKNGKGGLKSVCAVFADILFRPSGFGPNDMTLWK